MKIQTLLHFRWGEKECNFVFGEIKYDTSLLQLWQMTTWKENLSREMLYSLTCRTVLFLFLSHFCYFVIIIISLLSCNPSANICNGLALYLYYDSHLSFPIVEFFGRGEINHLGNFEFSFLLDRYQNRTWVIPEGNSTGRLLSGFNWGMKHVMVQTLT